MLSALKPGSSTYVEIIELLSFPTCCWFCRACMSSALELGPSTCTCIC